MKHINTSTIAIIILYITLLCCNNNVIQTTHALEATFTPNPEDSIENGGDGGPLPVSMQQRKQLLELEAAIINSQDPAATLNHVAQQNNMSQEELAGMLERNHKDLQESGQLEGMMGEVNASLAAQQQGSRSMAGSLPRRIVSLITSIILALIRTASVQISKNPKQSTLLFILLTATLLSIYNAPKNGIVISHSGVFPPFCRGHTTLLEPPIDYLERYSVQSYERNCGWISSLPEATNKQKKKKSKSNKQVGGVGMTSSLDIDTSNVDEGEITVNTNRRMDGYALIATASTLLTIDETDAEDEELQLEEIDCMHESIKAIIEERKFTEFIPGKDARSLKFKSFLIEEDMSEGAIFSMKLLGDFGRYGLQPLCISYEIDNDDDSDEEEDESTSSPMTHCVAFHTLTGGHFDGELQFLVQETTEGDVISVTLAIPKGGRSPSTRLAESMVSSLTSSIAQSAHIRTKQTLARRSQSKSYRTQATSRAKKKRHMRYEQEKLQEEMAAERKRKWKRNNKDVGRYRPTGCRGPSGGPKFGF